MFGSHEDGQTYVAIGKDGIRLHSEPRVKGKFFSAYLDEHPDALCGVILDAEGNVIASMAKH